MTRVDDLIKAYESSKDDDAEWSEQLGIIIEVLKKI